MILSDTLLYSKFSAQLTQDQRGFIQHLMEQDP